MIMKYMNFIVICLSPIFSIIIISITRMIFEYIILRNSLRILISDDEWYIKAIQQQIQRYCDGLSNYIGRMLLAYQVYYLILYERKYYIDYGIFYITMNNEMNRLSQQFFGFQLFWHASLLFMVYYSPSYLSLDKLYYYQCVLRIILIVLTYLFGLYHLAYIICFIYDFTDLNGLCRGITALVRIEGILLHEIWEYLLSIVYVLMMILQIIGRFILTPFIVFYSLSYYNNIYNENQYSYNKIEIIMKYIIIIVLTIMTYYSYLFIHKHLSPVLTYYKKRR